MKINHTVACGTLGLDSPADAQNWRIQYFIVELQECIQLAYPQAEVEIEVGEKSETRVEGFGIADDVVGEDVRAWVKMVFNYGEWLNQ